MLWVNSACLSVLLLGLLCAQAFVDLWTPAQTIVHLTIDPVKSTF